MPEWVSIVVPSVLGGGLLSALFVYVATRKRDTQTAVSERFDDAKELAELVRVEVENATRPLRERVGELESAVKALRAEARNLHDGIREWANRLWVWNRTGRPGNMPGPPARLRESVDLDYLLEDTEPSQPRQESGISS